MTYKDDKRGYRYIELLKFEDGKKCEETQVFTFSEKEADIIRNVYGLGDKIRKERLPMCEYDETRYRYIQDDEDGIPQLVDLENPLTGLVDRLAEQLYAEDPEIAATAKEIAEKCPSVMDNLSDGSTMGYEDLLNFVSAEILEPHPECIREGVECDVIYGTTLEFVRTESHCGLEGLHVFSKACLKEMGIDAIEDIYGKFVDGETFVEIY